MNKRIEFIDWIRVVACLMVMLVHASENFYGADSSGLAGNVSMLANEANRFWVSFYDGFVSRAAVPLFMIVSAFLLVPMKPGQTMSSFYKHRFGRILPPFVFFLLLYTFLPLLWGGMTWEQSLADLKLLPFNFPSMAGHLWFMYPLISLYIIIPVVSPWLEKASAKDERIFLGFFIFTTFIPWFRLITPELWGECFWNNFSAFWYCSGYLGYLVLAHYIRVHVDWDRRKRLTVGLLCFLVGGAFTGWSFWLKGTPGVLIPTPEIEWSWSFCTPNVLMQTFGLFLMFSCIGLGKAGVVDAGAGVGAGAGVPAAASAAGEESFVSRLARLTFGMYLVHMFFLAPIATWIIGGDVANPTIPVAIAIPAIAILSYICSAVAVKLVSLIPGSKYLVGV
ncbi:MAG: acyltransferase [Bacteroidales bacterium]|nr:acyltransferase [Bacteroidales bacterium]